MLGAVGIMELVYVCEWENWAKNTYCPSLPLACAWSCRNLIAFTTDLRNDDQGECRSIEVDCAGFGSTLPQISRHSVSRFERLMVAEPGSLLPGKAVIYQSLSSDSNVGYGCTG